jgi:hypothetical protein
LSDDDRYEWSGFRRKSWGPVSVVARANSVEATVGGRTVVLDLTDRRPAQERQRSPIATPFRDGVPVELDGRQVAIVRRDPKSPLGLFLRRARFEISGDADFVLPGMRFTDRGWPVLLTLRSDAGTMVSSNRWTAPWNDFAWVYALPGQSGFGAPRVAPGTRPEHVALWLAMKETRR